MTTLKDFIMYFKPKNLIDIFHRHRKLKSDILFESLTILSLSILMIIGYTYINNTQAFFEQSKKYLKASTITLEDKIARTLAGTEAIVNAYVPLLVDIDLRKGIEHLNLINSISAVLGANNQVSTIYYGTPEGYYFECSTPDSLKSYMARIGLRIPENTTAILKEVINENLTTEQNKNIPLKMSGLINETNEYWYYVIANKSISEPNIGEKTGYDPRKRGWYISASKSQNLTWSDVYLFAATVRGETGITASRSIYDREGKFKGVFAVDISLLSFSKFLADSKISPNSQSYIINETAEVIASSTELKSSMVKEDSFKLMTVQDSNDPILISAIKEDNHRNSKDNFVSFTLNGKEYIAAFEDFPKTFGNDWRALVICPTDDFIGSIKESRNQVLLYSLFILLIAFVLAYQLARRISTPITLLAEEAQRIQDLDLSGKLIINSKIKEIIHLARTMSSLKTTMQSFSYYIPKTLVKQLINRKQSVHVGGKMKEVTMMFTDIENFTTVSEQTTPDRLVVYLSEYFEELTKIIMESHGTVDKYIGDAIMAFWGAPVPDRHHVFHACRAAMLCQRRLTELNRQWKRENRPIFNTRIGIHVGEVIIGNMGSTERMNYTAIGDSVNLCARLEGINKIYGTNIIVSETVYDLAKESFLFRRLDNVAVKGKAKSIRIYELMAQIKGDNTLLPTDEQMDFATHFNKAYNLFLTRQWHEALTAFEGLIAPCRSDHSVALYIERCKMFIENPPPKEWDGTVVMHEK